MAIKPTIHACLLTPSHTPPTREEPLWKSLACAHFFPLPPCSFLPTPFSQPKLPPPTHALYPALSIQKPRLAPLAYGRSRPLVGPPPRRRPPSPTSICSPRVSRCRPRRGLPARWQRSPRKGRANPATTLTRRRPLGLRNRRASTATARTTLARTSRRQRRRRRWRAPARFRLKLRRRPKRQELLPPRPSPRRQPGPCQSPRRGVGARLLPRRHRAAPATLASVLLLQSQRRPSARQRRSRGRLRSLT